MICIVGDTRAMEHPNGGEAAHSSQGAPPGLYVQPSIIEGAGMGLFTRLDRDGGDIICLYEGHHLPTVEALRLPDKTYLMRLGPQMYLDARECPEALARYINDCRNPRGHNVRFEKRPEEGRALVVATRSIRAGEELFADYGRWYWAGKGGGQRLSDKTLQSVYDNLRNANGAAAKPGVDREETPQPPIELGEAGTMVE